jgi:DNA-binding FadR family transcriptional regulator
MTINQKSEFFNYLTTIANENNGNRLPSLAAMSAELGISVASLREQMEVARAMGLIDARPKTGIRILPYQFSPAVTQSLTLGVSINPELFHQYYDLRKKLEDAFWFEAVERLMPQDIDELSGLLNLAESKLKRSPIQIPHEEHKKFHLIIYRRLNNLFVQGLLESYWDLYDAVGYGQYNDEDYIKRVWQYHRKIVEALRSGDFEIGYRILREHMALLFQRNNLQRPSHLFE